MSNESGPNGGAVASPSTNSAFAGARFRASARSSGTTSIPTTSRTSGASASANAPAPVPASSARSVPVGASSTRSRSRVASSRRSCSAATRPAVSPKRLRTSSVTVGRAYETLFPAARPLRRSGVRRLEGGRLVLAEHERGAGEDLVDLVGAPEPDDGAVDRRVAEGPGDRDRARSRPVALRDRAQPLHELEVRRELRLAEALAAAAPVVVGQRRDPLAGHLPGQQARAHRRVDDDADPLALGERQHL